MWSIIATIILILTPQQQQPLTLALVDPYEGHNVWTMGIVNQEGAVATLYDENILMGMLDAYNARAQVVIVEGTLFCHPAYLAALLLLSTTSQVYVAAGDERHTALGQENCPDYLHLMTVVSGIDINGNKPPYLIHSPDVVDIWVRCYQDPCSTSEAVAIAGARAALGVTND